MNVTCRKCGATVPSDHAFCTDCGAVMAEPSAPAARETGSDEAFISTVIGKRPDLSTFNLPPRPKSQTPAQPARPSPARAAPPPGRSAGTRPEKPGRIWNLYLLLGFAAVVLLGLLLLYLLSTIFSG